MPESIEPPHSAASRLGTADDSCEESSDIKQENVIIALGIC